MKGKEKGGGGHYEIKKSREKFLGLRSSDPNKNFFF